MWTWSGRNEELATVCQTRDSGSEQKPMSQWCELGVGHLAENLPSERLERGRWQLVKAVRRGYPPQLEIERTLEAVRVKDPKNCVLMSCHAIQFSSYAISILHVRRYARKR
jgi:hypothetical protein